MEGVSARVCKGVKEYWSRRGYERLNGTGRRRKNRVELGRSGSTRTRRFWRIRVTPKLKLPRFSPKKFFLGLRDAYVKMMLRCAGDGVGGFGARPIKEYDERMIIELYKSLVVAQGQLVPRDAAKMGTAIVCPRICGS